MAARPGPLSLFGGGWSTKAWSVSGLPHAEWLRCVRLKAPPNTSGCHCVIDTVRPLGWGVAGVFWSPKQAPSWQRHPGLLSQPELHSEDLHGARRPAVYHHALTQVTRLPWPAFSALFEACRLHPLCLLLLSILHLFYRLFAFRFESR